MKRWLCWLFLAIGVVMVLWISHRPVHVPVHPQDRTVLSQTEFVFTVASLVLRRSHFGPKEFFAIEFGLSTDIADEGGPPWLDYRGPPGSHACRHDSGYSLQGCWPGWQLKGESFPGKFRSSGRQIQNMGFSTPFS